MKQLAKAHFADQYLLQPTNPLTVNLIGAGGTGSQMLTALARINYSLVSLQHAGLFVRVFDDDVVTKANLGRQLFSQAELGLNKGVALINRINRFFGTNWKALTTKYDSHYTAITEEVVNITVSCVDNAKARFEIARILKFMQQKNITHVNRPMYWLDFGNSHNTGQVILATVGIITQPNSRKFKPVGKLPFVTDEFRTLLNDADTNGDTPSCSLAEALTKQDLFINSSLANMGASLLWQLFREGMIDIRGFFMNLKDFRTTPLKIG